MPKRKDRLLARKLKERGDARTRRGIKRSATIPSGRVLVGDPERYPDTATMPDEQVLAGDPPKARI